MPPPPADGNKYIFACIWRDCNVMIQMLVAWKVYNNQKLCELQAECLRLRLWQRILSLPEVEEVTLLSIPQNPVCLFWSSPRWYICLLAMAILHIGKHQLKFCATVIEENALDIDFWYTDTISTSNIKCASCLLSITHLFFLLTIMSIVWISRLSRATMSLSVTFLYTQKKLHLSKTR